MQDPIYADLATEAAYVALLRWVDDYCQDGIVDAERTVPVAAPSPLSPRSSPPVGSPLSARSPATHPSGREQGGLAWQQRAQRAWEAGAQREAEAQMGGGVRVAADEEISIFVDGQWVLATVFGHGVAHGLHELRDVGGRVRAVDLSAAQWLYASVFRGEESLSQMARMA